ncbi:hypothetical protein [Achromobacter sp. DH1f]|uniref:hypothetical protein n=1 Tax=Achromobacter sp. DH1f TaxID=1397275 RepID=UPI000469CEF7|nr:hypothetical protein [Achromobacter sp. DH1f]
MNVHLKRTLILLVVLGFGAWAAYAYTIHKVESTFKTGVSRMPAVIDRVGDIKKVDIKLSEERVIGQYCSRDDGCERYVAHMSGDKGSVWVIADVDAASDTVSSVAVCAEDRSLIVKMEGVPDTDCR